MSSAVDIPLVLVTVGSDHHPFDRLVRWVDEWYADRAGAVRCVVQHGTSAPPTRAEGSAYLPHDELQRLMREAAVVVTQGGPMSIVETRRAGSVPVVVPRSSALGEHVDDHQQAFCRRLAGEGLIRVPADGAELGRLLDHGLAEPDAFAAAADEEAVERVRRSVARIETIAARLDLVARPAQDRPRVLLLAGSGRSGSTLLERALGGVPGVCALGETVHLWERGVRDHELCGCGEPFPGCPFWARVGEVAFGGWDSLDVAEVVDLRHAVVRSRHLPALLLAAPGTGWRLRRDRLGRLLAALFRAIQQVSGARLLVDSSKLPAYAGLLRHAGVDLRCAHVVRDPRGVAYSLGKTVVRPEVVDGSAVMHQEGPVGAALWWSAYEVLFAAVGARGTPLTSVRYEDLVADPEAAVRRLLAFAGLSAGPGDLEHLRPGEIDLAPGHLVAGNPMRFRTGHLELRLDEDWRDAMPARDRRLVDTLTAGLRRRHGYP